MASNKKTYIYCPREKSDMTPCVARDGKMACADDGVCVGCGAHPAELLKALVLKTVDQNRALEEERAAVRELVEAAKGVRNMMGMHGPCEHNSCVDCTRVYWKIDAALKRATEGGGT